MSNTIKKEKKKKKNNYAEMDRNKSKACSS